MKYPVNCVHDRTYCPLNEGSILYSPVYVSRYKYIGTMSHRSKALKAQKTDAKMYRLRVSQCVAKYVTLYTIYKT